MNALYLIRHSLTRANEARLYGGSTDLPLSPAGRDAALRVRAERPLPKCGVYLSSGMKRANETLSLLTGRQADIIMPEFREMDFGAFEMRSYDQLKAAPDYIRWIEDTTGSVACPGGESMNAFRSRTLSGAEAVLRMPQNTALLVCHGGVIVNLMQAWFPQVERHFYQWQPSACCGYRVTIEAGSPVGFEEI